MQGEFYIRTRIIGAVSDQPIVGTNLDVPKKKGGFSFGQGIPIQQYFFRRIQAALFPAMDAVLFFFFGTVVIIITLVQYRHTGVILFDAAFHFLEQLFPHGFGMRHHGICILIFRFQVADHLGVGFVF